LEEPFLASVITAAAPNAGAVARNQWADLDLVPVTLGQRAELVLEVAVRHEVKQLVLGAWGCGVFRNDPRQVAGVFGELLAHGGRFAGAFSEVLFAVPDHSDDGWVHRAFADCLL